MLGVALAVPRGLKGGIWIAVAHGISSPAIFFFSYILYKKFNSRSLLLCKGVNHWAPLVGAFWFFRLARRGGLPPTLGFLGEIQILMASIFWIGGSAILVIFVLLLSILVSIILYRRRFYRFWTPCNRVTSTPSLSTLGVGLFQSIILVMGVAYL